MSLNKCAIAAAAAMAAGALAASGVNMLTLKQDISLTDTITAETKVGEVSAEYKYDGISYTFGDDRVTVELTYTRR